MVTHGKADRLPYVVAFAIPITQYVRIAFERAWYYGEQD